MKTATILGSAIISAALLVGVAGCAETQPRQIPMSALQVGSGTGAVSYRTASHGIIYIYDKTWNQLVYSGEVRRDQLVALDPANGRLTIDSRVAVEKPLGTGDEYQIYLDTSENRAVIVQPETIIVQPDASGR